MMLDEFKARISPFLSTDGAECCLCAVSGGVDSMVMLELMRSAKISIAVAHVDHNTRDGESTTDALFVEKYCKKHKIQFHKSTIAKGALSGVNFQAAARDFRYKFFNELVTTHHYQFLCTAHHKTDRWETFLYNLSRAAGLDGLSTLRYFDHGIARPLLPFTRQQIEEYASQNDVAFVHDASNDSDDYTRNQIRHQVTPSIESIFPKIVESASQSAEYLDQERLLLQELIEKAGLYSTTKDGIAVSLDRVRSYDNRVGLLHRVLCQFGFTRSDCKDMLLANTGAQFRTHSHEALVDRGVVWVRIVVSTAEVRQIINRLGKYALEDGRTLVVEGDEKGSLSFPLKLLGEELVVRSWKAGDRFQPQGMGGKSKKVKKFLTDLKLSSWEKEKTLVLEYRGAIVQIVGLRGSFGHQVEGINERRLNLVIK